MLSKNFLWGKQREPELEGTSRTPLISSAESLGASFEDKGPSTAPRLKTPSHSLLGGAPGAQERG